MNYIINMPNDVKKIISILQQNNHTAYIVGGCVRDSILGIIPHDWDICTSATPNEMLNIFSDKKIIETGLKHGTITIVLNNISYEITTYRIDGKYTDGRRPDSVSFTNNLIEDLSRRDFTINAIAYNDQEGLIDPFNGLDDIHNKIIRCVGNPKDRFNEDALRIMRSIRFSCQLNFNIHPSIGWEIGYTDICEKLNYISSERINNEFCKMIICNDFYKRFIWNIRLFKTIFPELNDIINNYRNEFLLAINALKNCKSKDLITRLSIFFYVFNIDQIEPIMKRLRFDCNTINKVKEIIAYKNVFIKNDAIEIKSFLNNIGLEQFEKLLILNKLYKNNFDYYNIKIKLNEIILNKECYTLKDLAINGNDIQKIMLIKEGKDIGYWLNIILQKVMKKELNNTRDDLIYYMTGITDGWIKF